CARASPARGCRGTPECPALAQLPPNVQADFQPPSALRASLRMCRLAANPPSRQLSTLTLGTQPALAAPFEREVAVGPAAQRHGGDRTPFAPEGTRGRRERASPSAWSGTHRECDRRARLDCAARPGVGDRSGG